MAALSSFSWGFEGTDEERNVVKKALKKFEENVDFLIGNQCNSFHDEGKLKDATNSARLQLLKDFKGDEKDSNVVTATVGEAINKFAEFILKTNAENRKKAEKENEALISKLVGEHKATLVDTTEAYACYIQIENLQEIHSDSKLAQVNHFLREGNSGNPEFQQFYQKKLETEMDQTFAEIEKAIQLKLEKCSENNDKLVGEAGKQFEEEIKSKMIERESKYKQAWIIEMFIDRFNEKNKPYPKGSQELEVFTQSLKQKLEGIIAQLEIKADEKRINSVSPEQAPKEALSICETFFNSKMDEKEEHSRAGYLEEHEMMMAFKSAQSETLSKYIHLKGTPSSTHVKLWDKAEVELKEKMEKDLEKRCKIHKIRKADGIKKAEKIVAKCLEMYSSQMNTSKDGILIGPEDFQRTHEMAKEAALREFEEKSRWEDSEFFMAFQNKLRDSIEWSKQDFYSLFQSRILRENSLIDETIEACQAIYHKEMKSRFDGLNFIKSVQLTKAHEVASKLFIIKCKEQYKRPMSPYQIKRVEEKLAKLHDHYQRMNNMTLNSKAPAPAIGIDLGTTYSCVAVHYNGKVHVIPYFNSMGQHTIPSYVAFQIKENGEWDTTVGTTAKDSAPLNPSNTIYDVKRLIGRKFSDPSVQKNLQSCGWPFEVIDCNEDGVPRIGVFNGRRYFTPEEVSGKLLREIRRMAAGFLGLKDELFTKVVVTHPASFNDGQKQATKDAAKLAGFEEITLLNEPTAAAVAYSLERLRGNADKVLVFDYGGGTLDVCLIKVKKDEVEVIATEGDPKCGGRDLDRNLMNYCAKEFLKMNGRDPRFDIIAGMYQNKDIPFKSKCKRNWGRLQLKCENAKIALSTGTECFIYVDKFCNDVDLGVTISREKFNELNEAEFQKAIGCLHKLMKTKNVYIDDIDEIVLVGGSSRIPRVQELLENIFLGKTLSKYIPPDHAVAYGAAIKAALRFGTETKERLKLEKIRDVISTSIGIEAIVRRVHGYFDVLIEKNTKIPTNVWSKRYATLYDGQTGFTINVYQGESKRAKNNELLGTFHLDGVRPAPAGVEKAVICMEIDEDGILHVKATSVSRGHHESLTVKALKSRLSDDYIQDILAEETTRKKLNSIRKHIEMLAKEVRKFEGSCHARGYSEIKVGLLKNWSQLREVEGNVKKFKDLELNWKNSFQQISDSMRTLRAKIHHDGRYCANCAYDALEE